MRVTHQKSPAPRSSRRNEAQTPAPVEKHNSHLEVCFTHGARLPILCFTLSLIFAPCARTSHAAEPTNETHWSLQPVKRPTLPAAPKQWKPRNPIDHFIFARLAGTRLAPSPEATRRVLLRRLYFDLLGLPPTPEAARAFETDKRPDAYERVVEQLLASPHYGERWAQHWLDVVRFAETHGFEMNQPRPNAWRYRDYVIASFNDDKPYDRFVAEQLAGDVLGEDAATGFLVAGSWDQVKSVDPVLTAAQRADELHDMVGTTGTAFLGMTVGCARCHNHKFDPIPQVDYYAMKACLAGVQHGERKLRTPELSAQEKEAAQSKTELEEIEKELTRFEPLVRTGRLLMLEPEPAFGSKTIHQYKPARRMGYSVGSAPGEKSDPGGPNRLPNLSRGFLTWSNCAGCDVFAFQPGVEGRFRIELSWGAGPAQATDAAFYLDKDGDLRTTDDQVKLATVNQRLFATQQGEAVTNKLWSGFYDAGVFELTSSNLIVLRGGTTPGTLSVGTLGLVEEESFAASQHALWRAPVNPRRNVERFVPTAAKRLRFTIERTTDAEPCIDELEVYTAGTDSTNVAAASFGTKPKASSVFPNSDLHTLAHLNDGAVGNSHSWISNERGKGWVELEFPQMVTIDRVVWGRDREQQYADRLALEYRIEVAAGSNDWRQVASSQDRIPYNSGRTSVLEVTSSGLTPEEAARAKDLGRQKTRLENRLKELSAFPMVYAGVFTNNPDPTHRLQRGDAMQKREIIEAGALSAIPVSFHAPTGSTDSPDARRTKDSGGDAATPELPAMSTTEDQKRRLGLAQWISDSRNPLPARVIVNRLWQHHFGEGLVSTPSDFGKKGSPPSHPELLDWLASELVKPATRGTPSELSPKSWSLKHIHRLIVTSTTYRQASATRPEAARIDTGSRLLWRYPPQRLEAEPLRDTILFVSGKLNEAAGGPGFSAFEANDNYVRVYNPRKEFGPPEWRRMIYMTKVRMQQDSTFGAFDCPDGGQVAPKRMHSTTPLQALNLLNSSFMLQQSDFFAERLRREAGNDVAAQVRRAFELAYNRPPDADELKAARAFIGQQTLSLFCRTLFNSNEFLAVD